MASMTRVNMKTELQARGWSRFGSTELDKYLDWALAELYAMGNFPRSQMSLTEIASQTTMTIAFTSILTNEGIDQIEAVQVKDPSGTVRKLTHASDVYWQNTIFPASRETSPLTGPVQYYYVWDFTVYLYPKPEVAVAVTVHYTVKKDLFSGDSDTTGLPERYDPVVVALAEVHCARRARDYDGLMRAQQWVRDYFLTLYANEFEVANEGSRRVIRFGS